jgi:hypothetical protein
MPFHSPLAGEAAEKQLSVVSEQFSVVSFQLFVAGLPLLIPDP